MKFRARNREIAALMRRFDLALLVHSLICSLREWGSERVLSIHANQQMLEAGMSLKRTAYAWLFTIRGFEFRDKSSNMEIGERERHLQITARASCGCGTLIEADQRCTHSLGIGTSGDGEGSLWSAERQLFNTACHTKSSRHA